MTTRPSPNVTLLDLVVLPLPQRQLLLPASALAEVLPKWQSRPLPETPQWCAGELEWRQRRLPLIDFERWSGEPDTPGRWLVVCNRSQDDLLFTHYGVLLAGRPRLLRLRSNQLRGIPTPSDVGIGAMTLVEGERYAIPDLMALERQIDRAMRGTRLREATGQSPVKPD